MQIKGIKVEWTQTFEHHCIFDRLWPLSCYCDYYYNYSYPKLNIYKTMEQDLRVQIDYLFDLCGV